MYTTLTLTQPNASHQCRVNLFRLVHSATRPFDRVSSGKVYRLSHRLALFCGIDAVAVNFFRLFVFSLTSLGD